MKKILLSTVALLAFTAAAGAADLPSRRAPAPVFAAVPVFTWTGFYVGVQGGYAWGNNNASISVPGLTASDDIDFDGVVGGAHAGFNYQFGSIVAGIEGDIEATDIQADVAGLGFAARSKIDFQGSIRGRVGVAFDRALIYGTGGLAFANFNTRYSGFGATESFDNTEWGWTLGAGVEYAITNNLTARVEYRYTRFDSFNHTSAVIAPGAVASQEPDFHTVRVGVSYKF
jgi:outer membrane immunogenic protein